VRGIYHGAAAAVLEELYRGRTDEVTELLAFHLGRSDEAENRSFKRSWRPKNRSADGRTTRR